MPDGSHADDGRVATQQAVQAALTPRPVYDDAYVQFVEPGEDDTDCPSTFLSSGAETVQGLERLDLVETHPQWCRMPPQWWLLEVFAFNVQTVAAAVARQNVIRWGDVKSSGLRCSGARLIIIQQGDEVRVDVGRGNRYSLFSNNVTVKLEVPTPAQKLTNNFPGGVGLGVRGAAFPQGLSNTIVMATIRSNVASLGQRTGLVTCSVNVPAGVLAPGIFVPIPNRALSVLVYQDTAGGAPTPLNFVGRVGATPPASVDRGLIDFLVGTSPTPTGQSTIPGNACFILTGVQARNLTFVFKVEF